MSGVDVVADVRNGDAPLTFAIKPTGELEVDPTDVADWTLAVTDEARTHLRAAYLILSYRADPG